MVVELHHLASRLWINVFVVFFYLFLLQIQQDLFCTGAPKALHTVEFTGKSQYAAERFCMTGRSSTLRLCDSWFSIGWVDESLSHWFVWISIVTSRNAFSEPFWFLFLTVRTGYYWNSLHHKYHEFKITTAQWSMKLQLINHYILH